MTDANAPSGSRGLLMGPEMKVERIPPRATIAFAKFVHANRIDYFGDPETEIGIGREGWWGRASTYLRQGEFVLWIDGEPNVLHLEEMSRYADELEELAEQIRDYALNFLMSDHAP